MNDLISRQAMLDMANGWTYNFCDPEDEWAAMKEIRELPSAGPEIVRCKECKWSYDDVSGRICAHGVCVDCVVGDDFYCADAERRTDG